MKVVDKHVRKIRKARGLIRGKSAKGMKTMMLRNKAGKNKGKFRKAKGDYYSKKGGKKVDQGVIDMAIQAQKGKGGKGGDGVISEKDVEHILYTIKDSDRAHYSKNEKAAMAYIRKNSTTGKKGKKLFKFTPKADKKFRSIIASWAAKKGSKKTCDEEVELSVLYIDMRFAHLACSFLSSQFNCSSSGLSGAEHSKAP